MSSTKELLQAAMVARGKIIQAAVDLESLMHIYIAKHFADEETKYAELLTLVLAPRVTLNNTFDIFTYLVNTYNPEFKAANKKFTKHIKHIIEERNVYAHYPVDFSDTSKKDFEESGIITFLRYKQSSDYGLAGQRFISNADIYQLLKLIEHYVNQLLKLVDIDTASPPR